MYGITGAHSRKGEYLISPSQRPCGIFFLVDDIIGGGMLGQDIAVQQKDFEFPFHVVVLPLIISYMAPHFAPYTTCNAAYLE